MVAKRVAQSKHRLPQMNELSDTGGIRAYYTDAYPIGVGNLCMTRIFGVKWNKTTDVLLVCFLVLGYPVLKGGQFNIMQTAEVFFDHSRVVPLLDQVEKVLLLSGVHRFLPKS
jgi:hypothetical protein